MSNLKRDIEGVLDILLRDILRSRGSSPLKGLSIGETATTQIINLIESVVDNLKPDTNLLGCDKHWSDDSGGTCTCDENERTAIRFYEKAKDDIKSKLIGKE